MSKKPDYHLDTQFRLDPPAGRLKAFRLRYKSPDTDNKWVTLHLEEIALANALLKSGAVSLEHTKAKLDQVRAEQYTHRDRKKPKPQFMTQNMVLMERYWEETYTPRKLAEMKRPEESRRCLLNAVEAAGLNPLDTCDLRDLENYYFKAFQTNPAKHHRVVLWTNTLLIWLGRKPLELPDLKAEPVKYLNEEEFQSVLKHINNPVYVHLARIAFYTGLRLGEIFALTRRKVKPNALEIDSNLTKRKEAGAEKPYDQWSPKDDTSRTVFYPDLIQQDLDAWLAISKADKLKIRGVKFGQIMRQACTDAFGTDDPMMILTYRDLRHCAAIWLLQSGATMAEGAQQLGDGIAVFEKHYAGFELKKESIERLKRLINK